MELSLVCDGCELLLQVFMVSSKKIQERNYETLFRWLTQSNKINFIGRVVLSVPTMWQVAPTDLSGIEHRIGANHIHVIGHAGAISWGGIGLAHKSAGRGCTLAVLYI